MGQNTIIFGKKKLSVNKTKLDEYCKIKNKIINFFFQRFALKKYIY